MDSRPFVGVVPLVDKTQDRLWMRPGYFDGLVQAGAIPVMMPLTPDPEALVRIADRFDGFLFTGGPDYEPRLYGQETAPGCGEVCLERDAMELPLLSMVLERRKPVLGICRGLQLLNVALGGTLWQDLPSECPGCLVHRQEKPYDAPAHRVDIIAGTKLAGIVGAEPLAVNSLHHQAIRDLSPQLEAQAVSEDGFIEAVWIRGQRFALGVQWHPEFAFRADPRHAAIFQAFADAIRAGSC